VLTLVHASDLHFGTTYRSEVGEAFLVAARDARPDGVVVSGDLTQRAKVSEFEAAAAFLERLPDVPRIVVPGNHDIPLYRIWERLVAPRRNYRTYISEELDTVTRLSGAMIVALDSTEPHRAIVNGRIERRQIDFAREAFADAHHDDLRIVVAHHHFAPAPDYEGDKFMPGAKRVLEELTRMGVELILGGHLHRAYIGNSLDVFAGEDRERGVVVVQSGTTTSGRGRAREQAKNSFNVVRASREAIEVTHHMYFDELGAFAPFSIHGFPRRTHRWFPEGSLSGGLIRLVEREVAG
jgi:3',5'-cyclic AMP phosphodiesterase CpdA